MEKPVLLVMAAGMGSRYGGLKQMDPVDERGWFIPDYSLYDAADAGFEDVIFIIKPEMEEAFRETVGKRWEKRLSCSYAFQELADLPPGFAVPKGRTKPWGTGHAVLAARDLLRNRPFAVINSDDFYGAQAFRLLYTFLTDPVRKEGEYVLVAFRIENTVIASGSVSRGVCETDGSGYLTKIVERTTIEKREGGAAFTEDDGATWSFLPAGTPVSMNTWGFTPGFMKELEVRFPVFLQKNLPENPLKCEYFLPFVVDDARKEGKARIRVLSTPDRWHGITYRQDKPALEEALRKLRKNRYAD